MFYTHIWFVWQFASKNCRVISTNKYTHVYAYFIFCKSIPFFSCCQFSTIMIVTTSLNLKHEVFLSVWCLCRLQWWTRLWENKLAQGTCIYPKLDAPLLCSLASCKQPCVTALCRVHGICGLFWAVIGFSLDLTRGHVLFSLNKF